MLERLVEYNVDKYPDIYVYIYKEQLRETANKSDIYVNSDPIPMKRAKKLNSCRTNMLMYIYMYIYSLT